MDEQRLEVSRAGTRRRDRPADIPATLRALAEQVIASPELDDDAMVRVHNAAVAEVWRIQQERDWAKTAHVHEVPHAPVITTVPTEGLDEKDWPEEVDASGMVCHDCGRDLVADIAGPRTLVCPSLHGRRPGELVVKAPDGAVECGRTRRDA